MTNESPQRQRGGGSLGLPVALGLLSAAALIEWCWSRWAPTLLPTISADAILSTALARITDILLVVLFLKGSGGSWETVGLGRKPAAEGLRTGLIWCVILGLGALGIGAVYGLVYGAPPRLFSPLHRPWFVPSPLGWCYLATTALLSPAAEELIFRGVLYNALRSRMSVPSAILLSVSIFAAAHGSDWTRILPAAVGGLIFSLAFEKTRSLWTPLLIHSSGNTALWLYGWITLME